MLASIVGQDARLERQADKLLKQHHSARDPQFPAYPESYLIAKDKRRGEVSIEDVYEESLAQIRPLKEIFDCCWEEIRCGAVKQHCSSRQIQFLELRRYALPIRDIADLTGYSKSTVQRDLIAAAERIEHIPGFGIWSVLAEVFRTDVRKIRMLLLNG